MKAKSRTQQRQPAGLLAVNPATGKLDRGYFIYGSDPLTARETRRKTRQLLAAGVEPEPKYREGKSWRD